MKRNEIKKILKPLIKECIKEVIFEDGILSGLISEVVQGLGSAPLLRESASPPSTQGEYRESHAPEIDSRLREDLEERKRKLEESMGSQFRGILENTEPLSRGGSPTESKVQSPLATYAPNDAGVDISGLMALGGGKNWKNLI